ncbi:MAG: ABC transporter ATP-binding protein [Longimicrobiales bacterium]
MMPAISLRGVGKRFRIPHAHRPQTLHEALTRGFGRLEPAHTFWALRDIDFDVESGSSLGLIGANGAGKSTLLRLIAKVGRPDTGTIDVQGRISALLDLGAGFHPDLTGRENVIVSAVIMGMSHAGVVRRFDEIVSFAELEASIDNPLRTYSTGMRMRLAFAVAALGDPAILLVDEVLAVGDVAFQHKCTRRIAEMRAHGCTMVLCSHDTNLILELCDRAVWLERGRIADSGEARPVLEAYTFAAEHHV